MPHYNNFMHPNNIFRKKLDYKKLALEFKELNRHMTVGLRGKLRYNFDDPEALREFTYALMKSQFQKELILPTNRLIPAIPQRLNYICWLEDLLQLLNVNLNDSITGLDMGTGASCILPILGVHRNINWNFTAAEVDNESTEYAIENVQRNGLDDRIKVMEVDETANLSDIIQSCGRRPIHFITCNPPFFDQEYNGRTSAREDTSDDGMEICGRPKSKSNTANIREAVTEGGEIEFVRNLLMQSESCKEDVLIFTSMLGRKKSLQHYKRIFAKNDQINSWSWAELCQGKTIRYAIAWTFVAGLDLEKAPPLRLGKTKKWSFKLPSLVNDISEEFAKNIELLKQLVIFDLKIEKMNISRSSSRSFEFSLKTHQQPWLNQRRKRRVEAKIAKMESELSTKTGDLSNDDTFHKSSLEGGPFHVHGDTELPNTISMNELSKLEHTETSKAIADNQGNLNQSFKRKRNYSDELHQEGSNNSHDSDLSLVKIDEDEETETTKKLRLYDEKDNDDDTVYLVRCKCTLTRAGHDLFFELQTEHPCKSPNDAHDLFQYFKNKLSNP